MGAIEGVVDLFVKLLGDLSLKRLLGLFVLICAAAAALLLYERYTSSFALSRLERATVLLSQLQTMQDRSFGADAELGEINHEIRRQLRASLAQKPISFVVAMPSSAAPLSATQWAVRFFAGAAPWLLLSTLMLPDVFRRKATSTRTFGMLLTLGVLFGAIGAVMPSLNPPWLNLWLYPVVPIALFAVLTWAATPNVSARRAPVESADVSRGPTS